MTFLSSSSSAPRTLSGAGVNRCQLQCGASTWDITAQPLSSIADWILSSLIVISSVGNWESLELRGPLSLPLRTLLEAPVASEKSGMTGTQTWTLGVSAACHREMGRYAVGCSWISVVKVNLTLSPRGD